jgi:hypothetical protein
VQHSCVSAERRKVCHVPALQGKAVSPYEHPVGCCLGLALAVERSMQFMQCSVMKGFLLKPAMIAGPGKNIFITLHCITLHAPLDQECAPQSGSNGRS